jgi:hypothetical protein
MVWSKSKRAAVATMVCGGLICAGLVYSQQAMPQAPTTASAAPEFFTVQEPGKGAQKYILVRTFTTANGQTAKEMRNLVSGEVSTFYSDGPAPAQAVPTPSAPPVQPPSPAAKATPGLVPWANTKPVSRTQEVAQNNIPERSAPVTPASSSSTSVPGPAPESASIESAPPNRTGSSVLQWIKSKTSGQSQDAARDQVADSPAPAAPSTNSTLMQWIRSRTSSQSQDVAQDHIIDTPTPATPINNSSVGQWFKSKPASPTHEVAQDHFVDAPASQPQEFAHDTFPPAVVMSEGKSQEMQTPPPPVAAQPSSVQYRTVEEPGKPSLKCRVMVTWQMPDGSKASQLQAVESGQIMTIVESGHNGGAAGQQSRVTATLYHWGHNQTAPKGVPTPPPSALVAAAPAQPCESCTSAPEAAWPMENGPIGPMHSGDVVMMPGDSIQQLPNGDFVAADSSKPTLMGRIKGAFSSLLPGHSSASTTMTVNSYDAAIPMVKDVAQAPATSAAPDTAKANDTSKPSQKRKELQSSQPAEAAFVGPPAVDSPPVPWKASPADVAKTATTDETTAESKRSEMPAAPESITASDTCNADPGMPPAPVATKTPADPAASKLTAVGKPAVDTTLAPGQAPSIPPGVPANAVAAPSAPVVSSPPTPSQLITGNSAGSAGLPSSPSAPMLGSQFPGTAKNDPLSSPENFLPARMDSKAPNAKSAYAAPIGGDARPLDNTRVPLGAASVVAAGGDPRYLPVPMVTVPQARPPVPPPPQIPEAPNPTMYVNAFTPPMPEGGNPPMMAGGYGPMPVPVGPGMPMMPQGYPMPMPPMMAQGYPTPMVPMQAARPQVAPMPGAVQPTAYANPAMDRPGVSPTGSTSVQQCTYVVQSAIYPSQREMAIDQLCACDWRTNPHVVQVLLTVAKEDPAPAVRAAAVAGLTRMGVATDAAIATYNQLKTDADPRVRAEAERALANKQ